MTIPTSRAGIPLSTNYFAPLAGEIAGRDARHDSKVRAGAAQKLQTLPDSEGDLGPYSGEGAGIADGEHLRTVVGLTRANDGTCSGSAFPFCVMAVDDRTVREDWSLPVAVRTPSGTYQDASAALETAAQHLGAVSICTGPGWGVNGSTGVQSKWLSEGLGISLICVLNASSAQVRQIAGTLDDALRELPPPGPDRHADGGMGPGAIAGIVVAGTVAACLLACCFSRVREKASTCLEGVAQRLRPAPPAPPEDGVELDAAGGGGDVAEGDAEAAQAEAAADAPVVIHPAANDE